MFKRISVCAVVLALAVLVAAPAAAATTLDFGVKAGASFFKNAWTDNDGSEKTLIKPTFGAFALINLTPTIAIQPELNYLTTGVWWEDEEGDFIETYGYLHIPVLVRARLMQDGPFVPVLFAGPALGILLSAKWEGDDVKEFFKSTDFGLDVGVGGEVALNAMKLLIDARYYLGLANPFRDPDFSMKNRGFMVTAGLIF